MRNTALVILTREESDNAAIETVLKKYGIRTLNLPSITTRTLPIRKRTRSILQNVAQYDHIIFTSKKAQAFFVAELRRRNITVPMSRMINAGATNNILPLLGSLQNKRILFPRSAIGSFDVVQRLRTRGARVTVLHLYTTIPARINQSALTPLFSGIVAAIVFASPSAVTGFLKNVPIRECTNIRQVPVVCIGPTTAHAAKKAGFKLIHTAKIPTVASITKVVRKLIL